jgi:hypothetical protein
MILPAVALACLLLVAEEVDTNRSPTQLYDPGNIVDDQGVVRSREGRRVGQIQPDSGGGYALLDNDGRRVGSIEPGFNAGELVIRDSTGRRKGTLARQR